MLHKQQQLLVVLAKYPQVHREREHAQELVTV